MATYKKLLKEKKQEAKGPLDKANHVVKRMHMCCTYCHKQGHIAQKCWNLNPTMLPQKLKKVERELHVRFVVWLTIMFLDVGRGWSHIGNF